MRIVLAKWNAINEKCLHESLSGLGHEVFEFKITDKVFMRDDECLLLEMFIKKSEAEAVFSFNYMTGISDVCEKINRIYISWIFDSPHSTLYNKNVYNKCNKIFHFDKKTVEDLTSLGVGHVKHMELACDIHSFKRTIDSHKELWKYAHKIEFTGNLYNDPVNDVYSQIKHLPPKLRGYFEGAVSSALTTYGFDILDILLETEIQDEAKKYINIEISKDYFDTYKMRLKNILYKYSAKTVRKRIIESVAEKFELTLYTGSNTDNIKKSKNIHNMGYADYLRMMPLIFSQSAINLNITLRSIISGIPLRVLDILGCGGFLITNYQPEIASHFENYKDLVIYSDEDELLELLQYYSVHTDEAKQIAASGQIKCAQLFNYNRQLDRIFDAI